MFGLFKKTILKIKEQNWEKEKDLIVKEQQLAEEKKELLAPKKRLSTSKMLILFLFINCSVIEVFTGYVTLKTFSLVEYTSMMPDFTPLVTLIGAVVSEVIGFAIYSLKAAKENSKGGLIYDLTMNKNSEEEEVDEEEPEDLEGEDMNDTAKG